MDRRESFDLDPVGFAGRFADETRQIADRIAAARDRFATVKLPAYLRTLISELSTANNVAGHRADLIMEQAARAHAAWMGKAEVSAEDVQAVSGFALLHRRREAAPPPPPPPPPPEEDSDEDPPENEDENENREENAAPEEDSSSPEQENRETSGEQPEPEENPSPETEEDGEEQQRPPTREETLEQIFEVGETFKVKKLASPKDRVFRRGSGRRSRTRISQKQGRYVKSSMAKGSGDVALDATLRAAAPYQLEREAERNGLAVCLKPSDLREKIREKRIGNFLLFLVDASGSMGARGRMAASKGAVMSLLMDAYQKRDKVAMCSFRKEEAYVNLPPTSSIELAANLLQEMPVGGRTPLSAGLVKSCEITRNYLLREPTARPIVIIITDGKTNVALEDGKPVDEAMMVAMKMAADERIQTIVVDTEPDDLVRFGLAGRLAAAAEASYFKINDLKADTLLNIVKGEF